VYPVPINTDYVEKVIQAEKPDSIMLGFGGQTALNCGVALHEQGVLQKYGIRVLGTQIRGIEITEDRQLFKEAMIKSEVQGCKRDRLPGHHQGRLHAWRQGRRCRAQ
jgi:carbamoyl-phosphate synthase large subunit